MDDFLLTVLEQKDRLADELHSLNTEPQAAPFDFAFEAASDHELRELLDEELRRFHPEIPPSAEPPSTPTSATHEMQDDGGGVAASPPDLSDPTSVAGSGNGATATRRMRSAGGQPSADDRPRGGVGKRRR